VISLRPQLVEGARAEQWRDERPSFNANRRSHHKGDSDG
jgi:hypothetical protein